MREKGPAALRTARGLRDQQMPLYQIIFQSLRDEILSGRYDAAGQLPSELSLEERYKVSRITIRRACDELERAALIERSKGRSARLLPRLSPVVMDVQQELELHKVEGLDMRPKVLHFAWIIPDAILAETLDVAPTEKVLWVTRLRSRHDAPVHHSSVHIPQRYGTGISEELLGRMQLIDLWRMLGHVVASADQIMSAAPASPAMAQMLDLEPGDPIFCFRRLMRDADRRPMGLLYSSFRWDRFTYSMSLKQSEVEAQGTRNKKTGLLPADDLIIDI
jgi:GntR family transcriptional regulator